METAKRTLAVMGLISLFAGGGLGVSLASAQEQGENGQMGADHGQMDHGQAGGGHEAHDAPGAAALPESPATEAYRAANMAMHEAMNIEFTGNADIDFALGMIGHHLGAIDMARIVIEHGEDPELRQLAEEIIAAQEAEVAFLRNWLAERGQ